VVGETVLADRGAQGLHAGLVDDVDGPATADAAGVGSRASRLTLFSTFWLRKSEGGDEGDAEQRQAEQDAEDAQAPARAAPLAAGAGVGGVVPLGSRVLTDVWHRSSLGASATGPCPRPRWAGAGGRPRGIQ
jgi:hypothetical protein